MWSRIAGQNERENALSLHEGSPNYPLGPLSPEPPCPCSRCSPHLHPEAANIEPIYWELPVIAEAEPPMIRRPAGIPCAVC